MLYKETLRLLNDTHLKIKWSEKRKQMLSEKIDVTKFMTDFIVGIELV